MCESDGIDYSMQHPFYSLFFFTSKSMKNTKDIFAIPLWRPQWAYNFVEVKCAYMYTNSHAAANITQLEQLNIPTCKRVSVNK